MSRKYVGQGVPKGYTEKELKLAIESAANGLLSIREAAAKFHIPYTTFNSHVHQNVVHNHPGRPRKFNESEEICLEEAALALQVMMMFG